jgi:hypothetical protein
MKHLLAIVALCLLLQGCSDPAVSRAESAVRATLKDADSAKFASVSRCGQSDIVSGKVNAKNGFGGYDGPRTFVARGDVAVVDNGPEMATADMSTFGELMSACTAALEADTARIRKQAE